MPRSSWLALVVAAVTAAAACAKKPSGDPAAGRAARDGGAAPAAGGAELARCVAMVQHAIELPAAERAGTLLRGCGLCGRAWDPLIAADRADTGSPVDREEVWRILEACGGVCSKQAAAAFREQLGELGAGLPSTRPWRTLGAACGPQLQLDEASARFASGAWFALATIATRLQAAKPTLPAAEQQRLDAALGKLLLALPPLSAPGTGFIVPGAGLRPGTPWLQITLIDAAVFVGRLPFVHLGADGLRLTPGAPYPGVRLAALAELPAALDAERAPTAVPPPALADRLDVPVVIAPRAAPARLVIDALRALGAHRVHLAVAAPAPAALWRGLVAAHPLPLAATAPDAPATPRLRFGLTTARVAVVDGRGAVLLSAPLPDPDRPLIERWTATANALAGGRTVELVAEDGHVDVLAGLLDAAAGGAAALAVPAPAGATLTGHALPAFDLARFRAVLGSP